MNNYVKAVKNNFEVDGQPFKFVGFNIRGLAHYGDANILPLSTQEHKVEFLKAAAQEARSAVIRIFFPHSTVRSDPELINRLQIVLDLAAEYQQRVIVCLTDHYETSRFQHWSFYDEEGKPKGDYICKHQTGELKGLSPKFYSELYRGDFLHYVEEVVKAFKEHPAVFCWELTNEGSNHACKDEPNDKAKLNKDFINYCTDMANKIRTIDTNHMITTGIISTRTIEFENASDREELYKNLDFITLHDYPAESGKLGPDVELAHKLELPFIIEEVGVEHSDRGNFENKMKEWFGLGASGFLGWAYQPIRNGDGGRYGIEVGDGNYPQIIQLWHEWSEKFGDIPPLTK